MSPGTGAGAVGQTIAGAGLEPLLARWATEHSGRGARVEGVAPMPGNAGLSFGFVLVRPAGEREQLVIRLAPPGVRRQGNTDVLRQVPVLAGLRAHHVPVPAVVWWTSDPQWFGTDAFVAELLPGRPLHMTDARLSVKTGPDGVLPLLEQAVDVLVRIHAVPWQKVMPRRSRPRPLATEIQWWAGLLERVRAPSFAPAADRLRDALLDSLPSAPPTGLLHGDFQTNNVLFCHGRVTGVVDWELTGVGGQLLDLGWLEMMTDATCWEDEYARLLRVVAPPGKILERYEAKTGRNLPDVGWYKSLACFRFGVIVAFNAMLHRTGKRVDSLYEVLERSLPRLFERPFELVD